MGLSDTQDIEKRIQEDIARYGPDTTHFFLEAAPLYRMITEETTKRNTPISWCYTTFHLIAYLSAKDPTPLHFDAARKTIEKDIGQEKDADPAVDKLARELVIWCEKFRHSVMGDNYPKKDENGWYVPHEYPGAEILIAPKDGMLWLDYHFLAFISQIGHHSQDLVSKISEDSCSRFIRFSDGEPISVAWALWIDPIAPLSTKFLDILAYCLWHDLIKSKWKKESTNVPALTQGVHPSVAKILSHRVETKEIENKLYMVHSGKIIATLPTIDPTLIPTVTKGIGSLNSLYHHKLIRFECKTGFENWASGRADVRLLKFEGGCTEIAERLGFKSKRVTDEIKNILHAQAHMHFHFEDGTSGNLIVLSKFRSSQSGREEGIMITLGPQLLPHYTFQTSKKARLLIPVPELPPLISSSNSHAAQAALQMLVMQEFADQSIELAERGSIEISDERWLKLATEAGLSLSIFKQTLDRWLNNGNDGARFLVLKDKNRYSFGESYNKEEVFLIEQGLLRKKRQNEGRKSVILRKKK